MFFFPPPFFSFYGFILFFFLIGPWPGRPVVFWVPESKLWNRLKSFQWESIDLLHCNTDANNTMYLSSKKSGLIEHDMPLILMPARTEEELLPKGSREHVKPALQSNEHTVWLLHYTILILRNEKVPRQLIWAVKGFSLCMPVYVCT